jgi:hypothetical protein
VTIPRLRIAEIMAVVALTALDFGVGQALLKIAFSEIRPNSDTAWLLILGAVPMANILAIGLAIGHSRRGGRPFLVGFAIFGAIALASYSAVATLYPDRFLNSYLWLFLRYLPYPHAKPPWSLGLVLVASAVVLGLPQLVFTILGGILLRKLKC